MNCLNCETQYVGQFCPECGQKSNTKRLTLLTVVQDFMAALSDSDKGFLKTVIDLSSNPGQMLNDYVFGRRQRYLSAAKYTLLMVVLFTITLSALERRFGWFEAMTFNLDKMVLAQKGNNISISSEGTVDVGLLGAVKEDETKIIDGDSTMTLDFELFGYKVKKDKVTKEKFFAFIKYLLPVYHKTLFDSLKVFLVLWIPIFAFFAWIFFFKSPYNMAEQLTINSYIYSHILLIFVVLSPLYWIFPKISGTTALASFAAGTFYLIFAYMQVYASRPKVLLKTLASISLSLITYQITLYCLLAAMILYIAFENMEQL